MKKRGFTLIELLAVIVILAIIALIATPIVMNVIENSRKGAAERSAENYLSAVETAIASKRLEDGTIANGEYVVNGEGNLCQIGGDCLSVEVSGDQPRNGSTVVISEGIITKESINIIFGNYDVKYNAESEKFEANDYNPYAYGTKYVLDPGDGIERIFYVLEDGDTTTLTTGRIAQSGQVSLIPNRNYDDTTQAWCATAADNTCGGTPAAGLLEKLAEARNAWNNSQIISIDLPTYEQIYAINNNTSLLQSPWIYENLDNDWRTDIQYGHWTSTADSAIGTNAWRVSFGGAIVSREVTFSTGVGIRPVITISKANL